MPCPVELCSLWQRFRKGLRLQDNAALVEACKSGVKYLCPIFIIDPHFGPKYVGINRYNFLLDCLRDLNQSPVAFEISFLALRQLVTRYRSRLLVLRGRPQERSRILSCQWHCRWPSLSSSCPVALASMRSYAEL